MKERKKVLWVIGDSTLSSFNDKYYYPRYGYGTKLAAYLDDAVEVKNIALSGRSSKSYTTEPQYKELTGGMQKGDFLLIGFGHNDEKTEEARFTSAQGDYKTAGSFAASLYDNYIVPAQKADCQVILCTPIVRRTKNGEWNAQDLHVTQDFARIRAEIIRRQTGTWKNTGLPVVDMTKMTKALYETLGKDETVYLHAWTSE